MALNDLKGVTVARGTWFYDGVLRRRISVVASDYDVKWALYEAEGWLEEGEEPAEPGPEGLYYYVSASGPFQTIEEAKAFAEQSWGYIRWDAPRRWLRIIGAISSALVALVLVLKTVKLG